MLDRSNYVWVNFLIEKKKKRNREVRGDRYKQSARGDRVRRRTESRRLLTANCFDYTYYTCLSPISTMLSRAVLPLTRPNVLASAVRASALSVRSSPYTAYKLSPGIQQRAKSSKAKKTPKAPAPEPKEFAAEQPEFDTKAEPKAAESSGTVRWQLHPNTVKNTPLTIVPLARTRTNIPEASPRSHTRYPVDPGCRTRRSHEEGPIEPHRRPYPVRRVQ